MKEEFYVKYRAMFHYCTTEKITNEKSIFVIYPDGLYTLPDGY